MVTGTDTKLRKVSTFNDKSRKERWYVEICDMSSFGEKPLYGVNWAALGTQNTKQVKIFIKHLNEAIKLCDQLNNKTAL